MPGRACPRSARKHYSWSRRRDGGSALASQHPFPCLNFPDQLRVFFRGSTATFFSKSKFSPRRCPSTPAAFQSFAPALAPPPPGACALSPLCPLRVASCFAPCSVPPPSVGRAQGKVTQAFGTGEVCRQSSLALAPHPTSEPAPRLPGRGAWGPEPGARSARPRLGVTPTSPLRPWWRKERALAPELLGLG